MLDICIYGYVSYVYMFGHLVQLGVVKRRAQTDLFQQNVQKMLPAGID